MPILILAATNVKRRLSRSMISLIAMAVAAAVLTSGFSLSKGTPKLANTALRSYFEADIIMLAPGFLGASPVHKTSGSIKHNILIDSGFNPALQLFPSLKTQGYLAHSTWSYGPFPKETIAELARNPVIRQVEGFKAMPAMLDSRAVTIRSLAPSSLPYISEGAAPNPEAELLEVAINAYGTSPAQVGDIIELNIPDYRIDQHGLPYVDIFGQTTKYQAVVTGLIMWPSRSMHFPSVTGTIMQEEGYIHAAEAYLHPADWQNMWQQHSAGALFSPLSLRLHLNDMSQLNELVAKLRSDYPQYAVFTATELAHRGWQYGLLDRFYLAPAWMWTGNAQEEPPLAQEGFAHITAILLFINAGMLLASQMLASIASRRSEIGILKAIGARKLEVTYMILIEVMLLALLGAVIGFALMRLAAVHQSLSNGVPLIAILKDTGRELYMVLGLTGACALVFGVMPAWSVSRLTVMEVLRRD